MSFSFRPIVPEHDPIVPELRSAVIGPGKVSALASGLRCFTLGSTASAASEPLGEAATEPEGGRSFPSSKTAAAPPAPPELQSTATEDPMTPEQMAKMAREYLAAYEASQAKAKEPPVEPRGPSTNTVPPALTKEARPALTFEERLRLLETCIPEILTQMKDRREPGLPARTGSWTAHSVFDEILTLSPLIAPSRSNMERYNQRVAWVFKHPDVFRDPHLEMWCRGLTADIRRVVIGWIKERMDANEEINIELVTKVVTSENFL